MIQILAALLTAQPALPAACSEAACLYEDGVLIVASTEAEARLAHDAVTDGRRRFHAAFDVMPGRTALVLDPELRPQALAEARSAGFENALVWIAPARMLAFAEQGLRDMFTAQMEGAPEAVIAAAVDEVIAPLRAAGYEVLGHEAAHIWLMNEWAWPPPEEPGHFYGAPAAPDWLDELAAVAAEGEAMIPLRLGMLCERRPAPVSGEFLADYFSMPHPNLAHLSERTEGADRTTTPDGDLEGESTSGQATMTFIPPSTEAGPATEPGAIFYELARGLLDYAADRSSSAPLWGDLAGEIAGGGDFDAWLSRRGPDFGLPGDVEALAADFSAWLDEACAE